MIEDDRRRPVRFRLAWRWKGSGVSGSTPWTHRGELVEGWMESFRRRSGARVEHWIEVSRLLPDRHDGTTIVTVAHCGETSHA